MISNQERAKVQRNIEYQILQNKLENSEKSKRIEWWKDKNIYRYIEVLDDIKEHY